MSAFAVFSMMGFYPVTPGIPIYDIGSPIFNKTTIHLRNGKTFVIVANHTSHENKYVESDPPERKGTQSGLVSPRGHRQWRQA